MGKMLRLSDEEEELLRVKAVEINKVLIHKGMEPMKDSELAHVILKKAIKNAFVMADGQVRINGSE